MKHYPSFETPNTFEPYQDGPFADDSFLFDPFVDEEEFAEDYGLPIEPFSEGDLRFLRDFILSSALYVEQLEGYICDSSDEFWQAREHAYKIITSLLIRQYEYEMEE